jgi:hypothetical protein
MTAVSLGYGRFHSAFLPRAQAAAAESGVNPYRLIVELGRQDMMRMSPELLDQTVERLSGHAAPEVRRDLAKFSDARFGPRRIGNRTEALKELVDGLEVVASKRHLRVVLDLVAAPALDEDAITAEFVIEDDHMALGRLRFGSLDAAVAALREVGDRVSLGLLDLAPLDRGALRETLAALAPVLPTAIVPYSSTELELEYLGDVALARVADSGATSLTLLDPGTYPAGAVEALAARLSPAVAVERSGHDGLIVVAGPLGSAKLPESGDYSAIFAGAREWQAGPAPGRDSIVLDRAGAYRDTLPRFTRSAAVVRRSALQSS